jgi:hypothetical protein
MKGKLEHNKLKTMGVMVTIATNYVELERTCGASYDERDAKGKQGKGKKTNPRVTVVAYSTVPRRRDPHEGEKK